MSEALPWDLQYDSAQFIAIPDADSVDEAAWIAECLTRYGIGRTESSAAVDQIVATAMMMLNSARPVGAQLWFAPPGVYSDVLVTVDVQSSADRPDVDDFFAELEFSTAVDVKPVRTDTHGAGILVRWAVEIEADAGTGEPGILVAHWRLVLNDGTWTILIDALGSALPVFALFEEQISPLVFGITVPESIAA